jgi:hypothetical protein
METLIAESLMAIVNKGVKIYEASSGFLRLLSVYPLCASHRWQKAPKNIREYLTQLRGKVQVYEALRLLENRVLGILQNMIEHRPL